MAEIVKFPEANVNFVAEGCNDLPAFRGVGQDGNNQIISCWQLTPAELEEVNRTGRVYLHIWGTSQPPVCLNGHRPFQPQLIEN